MSLLNALVVHDGTVRLCNVRQHGSSEAQQLQQLKFSRFTVDSLSGFVWSFCIALGSGVRGGKLDASCSKLVLLPPPPAVPLTKDNASTPACLSDV